MHLVVAENGQHQSVGEEELDHTRHVLHCIDHVVPRELAVAHIVASQQNEGRIRLHLCHGCKRGGEQAGRRVAAKASVVVVAAVVKGIVLRSAGLLQALCDVVHRCNGAVPAEPLHRLVSLVHEVQMYVRQDKEAAQPIMHSRVHKAQVGIRIVVVIVIVVVVAVILTVVLTVVTTVVIARVFTRVFAGGRTVTLSTVLSSLRYHSAVGLRRSCSGLQHIATPTPSPLPF
mmetsp:Transcript_22441/g.88847  ORF Transcript_22441/g.88847 Transcript_22441/m.88847 type:complete len:230 (-) Transcript_22441:1-690(-)